jgi:cytosine deaminase
VTASNAAVGAAALMLAGPVLSDGRRVDVLVRGETVAQVGAPGTLQLPERPVEVLDLAGYQLLPAPVEPHAHLDKAYTAEVAENATGDLAGAIAGWLTYRPTMREADVAARAQAAVATYVANGATAIRTHVDLGADVGLTNLAAINAVRQTVARACDVQIVAFVSNPVSGRTGAPNRELLAQALAAGADLVGGAPALDPDPPACITALLAIAAEAGRAVDLHIDENLDPGSNTLSLLTREVRRTRFPHPVTASHCVSLGAMPPDQVARIADEVAAAGIAVVCLPQTNLYLQGRDHVTAPPRGLTALHALRAAGVRAAAGGDNLQDPFNCLGRADPLETATLLVLAGHDRPETAYASVSSVARDVLGLPAVTIRSGDRADLLAIRGGSVRQAVADASPDRTVIHAGRVVARTSTTRTVSVPSLHDPVLHGPLLRRSR